MQFEHPKIKDKFEAGTFKGIEFGHRQIYDIWRFLDLITELSEIKSELESSDQTDLPDEDDLYDSHPYDRWFEHDLDGIQQEKRQSLPEISLQSYRLILVQSVLIFEADECRYFYYRFF